MTINVHVSQFNGIFGHYSLFFFLCLLLLWMPDFGHLRRNKPQKVSNYLPSRNIFYSKPIFRNEFLPNTNVFGPSPTQKKENDVKTRVNTKKIVDWMTFVFSRCLCKHHHSIEQTRRHIYFSSACSFYPWLYFCYFCIIFCIRLCWLRL